MEIRNKKAYFDYQIVETIETGIVLTGAEVKSVRGGGVNMTGSRVVSKEDGLWVVGLNIFKYKFDGNEEYEPTRSRKLLVNKAEKVALETKMRSEGLTAVPCRMYNKGGLIKVEVGLVRGKKLHEKRALLKKRSVEKGLAKRLKRS